jgi:Rod binding domain-containing protein
MNGVHNHASPVLGLADAADVRTIAPVLPDAVGSGALAERQKSFAGILSRAQSHPGAKAATSEVEARESAEQFVAITFLQPLLKQLRETNRASAPFALSAGEKQMQGMLDAHVSQQIVSSSSWPLVDRIASDMLKNSSSKAGEP